MTGDHYVFIRNMALKSPQTGWAVVHNVFCWWNFCKVLRFTEVQVQWLTGHQTMVLGYNDSLLCARNGETSSSFFPRRKNRFRPLGMSFGCVVVAWGSNTVGLEDVLMTFDEYVEHSDFGRTFAGRRFAKSTLKKGYLMLFVGEVVLPFPLFGSMQPESTHLKKWASANICKVLQFTSINTEQHGSNSYWKRLWLLIVLLLHVASWFLGISWLFCLKKSPGQVDDVEEQEAHTAGTSWNQVHG